MLELPRDVYEDVIDHAQNGAPEEICGVLEGGYGQDSDHSMIETAHRAVNVADHPRTEYALDPEEALVLFDEIEDRGNEVVGFYHSHPAGPPHPSATDEARATWTDRSYVIVDLSGTPFVGSWQWTGDRFEQEIVSVR